MAKLKARCRACGKKVFQSKGRIVEHHDRKTNTPCVGSGLYVPWKG
jgi:hypothetical protein